MIGRFDDDFMGPQRPHPIVNSVGDPAGLAFNAIERLKMRDDPNLHRAVRGQFQQGLDAVRVIGAERASILSERVLTISHTHPTASDRVLTKFHTGNLQAATSANVSRRRRSLLQAVAVPNRPFTGIGGHLKILRQFQTIGGTSILAKAAKHAARGVVGKRGEHLAPRSVVALPANYNQVFRAGQRAKIARDAQRFAGFWTVIEPRRAAIALGNHRPLQRILLGVDVLWVLGAEGQQQALPEVHHEHPAKYFHHDLFSLWPRYGFVKASGPKGYSEPLFLATLRRRAQAAVSVPASICSFPMLKSRHGHCRTAPSSEHPPRALR